jgi:hypothetical protein
MEVLDILLSRLTWPSIMVRERAATEIARLLILSEEADRVRRHLLSWIATQQLESMAAIGLLVLLRAEILEPQFVQPTQQELDQAIRKPSLLTLMLEQEITSSQVERSRAMSLPHSGHPPQSLQPDPFFDKYVRSFLPGIYGDRAEVVQRQTGLPFYQHWSYEWRLLVEALGVRRSDSVADYWARGPRTRSAPADTLMSEVYRSAYLRSLAWALQTGFLPIEFAQYLAADTCPIHLDLWRVEPQSRPGWWPRGVHGAGAIDTLPAEIWKQVQTLWENRTAGFGEWTIGVANGLVADDDIAYELEIGGLLQKSEGPRIADDAEIATRYFDRLAQSLQPSTMLRFEGLVPDRSVAQSAQEIGDWTVVPLAEFGSTATFPRWQAWRVHHRSLGSVWFPSPLP